MDEDTKSIENFELLLQQQTKTKPIGLYGSKTSENIPEVESKSCINANDVITNVVNQIRAMRSADSSKTGKKSSINMYKCKKSTFQPVNMLQTKIEPPPRLNFETQHCTDTQLIDIVQNAEKVFNTDCGITQEFETSFFHKAENCPKQTSNLNKEHFPILDISLKEPDLNKSLDIISSPNDEDFDHVDEHFVDIEEEYVDMHFKSQNDADKIINVNERIPSLPPIDDKFPDVKENTTEFDGNVYEPNNEERAPENCNMIVDKEVNSENMAELDNLTQDNASIKPRSPVFNITSKKLKSRNTSPLGFNLDKFENFVKIALPIVEETTDKDLAKVTINSQIFGSELENIENREPILEENKNISPTIELSEDVVISKEELSQNKTDFTTVNDHVDENFVDIEEEYLNMHFKSQNDADEIINVDKRVPCMPTVDDKFHDAEENTTEFDGNVSEPNNEERAAENCNMIVDKEVNSENMAELDNLTQDNASIKPKSPVFNITSKKLKSRNTSPLDFNLDKFENFVKMALPIVEETTDKDLAKVIINSQIFSSKLKIIENREPILEENKNISPTIELSEGMVISQEELSQNKTNFTTVKTEKRQPPVEALSNDDSKSDKFLKDEILFSSDEEEDSIHKNFQDLPFTCALATSFYNQSDVLDKTMYVGFQTASNKSIIINTDSFFKAKDVLDSIEDELKEDVSLTQMVRNFDSNFSSKVEETYMAADDSLLKVTEEKFALSMGNRNKNAIKLPEQVIPSDFAISDTTFSYNKTIVDNFNIDSPTNNDVVNQDKTNGKQIQAVAVGNVEEKHLILDTQFNNDVEMEIGFNAHDIQTQNDVESNDLTNSTVTVFKDIEKPIELIDKPTGNFQGFKTANNKVIKLSEKALAKTKQGFQDLLTDNQTKNYEDNKYDLDIASADLEMADVVESLKDVEMVFDEVDSKGFEEQHKETTEQLINLNSNKLEHEKIDAEIIKEFEDDIPHSQFVGNRQNDNKNVGFVGFKTANNKLIETSDTALAESKKIFENVGFGERFDDKVFDKDEYLHNNNSQTLSQEICNKIDPKLSNLGFKTASNKDIAISEKGLTRMQNIFNDINLMDDVTIAMDAEKDVTKNVIKDDIGFKTARNKEIKVSEQAMQKTKNVFQDIVDFTNEIQNKIVGFSGFETANNKNIDISAQAMVRTKTVFEGLENDIIFDEKKSAEFETKKTLEKDFVFEDASNSSEEPPFQGFENVENDIALFEEVLAKSQKIIEKLEEKSADYITPNVEFEEKTQNLVGFQAYKKPAEISTKAWEKSKKIFPNIDNDQENKMKTENQEDVTFKGFQTANNKKVIVSEEALAKSRIIFQDIDKEPGLESRNVDSEAMFKGFQTASNKKINISEDALLKSRRILQDIEKSVVFEKKDVYETMFQGFQTASNKKVKISEDALAKTRMIFEDIDHETKFQPKLMDSETVFEGFQTASNKKVKISEGALAKSRNIFQDIDNEANFEPKFLDDVTVFKGFQTANNKKVMISEDALAKSRKMYQDMDYKPELEPKIVSNKSTFKGFETASNKKVIISEEALAKSRKMFLDFDREQTEDIEQTSSFQGFQIASNKSVIISREALAKSKMIFHDLDIQESETKTDDKETFLGFQTASNKAVNISEEALLRSKKLFQDLDKYQDVVIQNVENKTTSFNGFQTASNKEVKISEEALFRSRQMFQEIDTGMDNLDQKITFSGFKTASKKEVQISEEALAKTKDVFKEIDSDIEITKDMHRPATSNIEFGFKTGNDNKIAVSRESLMKSKKLLADTDKSGENTVTNNVKDVFNEKSNKELEDNYTNLIDTQVLNNFKESLNTEDFLKDTTPKQSKRSGSPILSCPKPKRRKVFQIPYSQKLVEDKAELTPPKAVVKPEESISFDGRYKRAIQYTLKDLERLENESTKVIVTDPYIYGFNFENLLTFEFTAERNDLKTDNPKLTLNIADIKTIFLNSVNKKLVKDGWIDIHLKLILWKLISYEIKFPKMMARSCTAKNVIEQLKYRYDKELYNAERPALRKIMERDDTSMKMLILCVVDIIYFGDNSANPELLLTDGWYCIRATIDKMLSKLVENGKIVVGTKMVTHGAELVGSDQAVSPWEDTTSLRLKLSGNSTRRAKWHTRLGYHGNGAILTRLSNARQDGGKISKIRVYLTRVYPALYLDKFEDGSTVTRSERLESIYQMKYETERQALLEKVYEEVEKEIYDQDSQDSEGTLETGVKRKCPESGTQIAKMMKLSKDPSEYQAHLTSSQAVLLQHHTAQKREKLIDKIQERVKDKMAETGINVNRNVVMLLKIRVVDIEERKNGIEVSKAMLSIWKSNDAVMEMIKEGSWIEILNVVPTAVRYSEIQLSAGRQSVFSQSNYKENEKIKPYTVSLKRTCYPIKDLTRNPVMTTDYNEIDTAGIVFQIDPPVTDFDSNKHQFQNVYFCDEEKNIICVNFWGGLKKFGFENVLDTGQVVAGTNLQKRAGNTRKNIPQYRVTEFSYFTKTPKNEKARKSIVDLEKMLSNINKKKFFEDCVFMKNNYFAKQDCNENVSPYRFPNMDVSISKNKVFIDSPLAQKTEKIDDNLNLTGLDFESTFKQIDTQELSPKTLLRKKQVQQKIAKLKMYGEPPPLSPIQILNKSKNAALAYKSPLISKSDVSPTVASEKKDSQIEQKNEEISCSPVICFNRTYSVKRTNVNPVKLNFSKNNVTNDSLSEIVNDFEQDFDGSPPLSLD